MTRALPPPRVMPLIKHSPGAFLPMDYPANTLLCKGRAYA